MKSYTERPFDSKSLYYLSFIFLIGWADSRSFFGVVVIQYNGNTLWVEFNFHPFVRE